MLKHEAITTRKNDTSIVDEIVQESVSPSRWRCRGKLWWVCLRARDHRIRREKSSFGVWGKLTLLLIGHYHKSQINTVRSNGNNFLIRLWWNLDYNTKGSSQSSKGKAPVFFHLRHIYIYAFLIIIFNSHREETSLRLPRIKFAYQVTG